MSTDLRQWTPLDGPHRQCLTCYNRTNGRSRRVERSASAMYGDENGNVPVCQDCFTGRHGDRELRCDLKACRLFLSRGGNE